MPENAHHCVYDCIKCQIYCPMNKKQIKNTIGPVKFNELETNMLLSGLHYQKQSISFNKKVKYLGLHQWPDGIPKNLKVLFEIKNSE